MQNVHNTKPCKPVVLKDAVKSPKAAYKFYTSWPKILKKQNMSLKNTNSEASNTVLPH